MNSRDVPSESDGQKENAYVLAHAVLSQLVDMAHLFRANAFQITNNKRVFSLHLCAKRPSLRAAAPRTARRRGRRGVRLAAAERGGGVIRGSVVRES
ncbi:hypothetical protein SRHO_G00309780 [Serrasalmus rhombeus]